MLEDIKIVDFSSKDASSVAALHISGIKTGFISSLGIGFVTALYEAIAECDVSFGYVAKKDGEVLGFSMFTTNLGILYKFVVLRNIFRFGFKLMWNMCSLRRIKKVFETLFYPSRIKKMNLPSAEFLSMVVAEKGRGKGLASRLMQRGFDECYRRGVEKIKIFAAAEIKPINKMYEKYGFELVGQMDNHGIISNVYVAETGKNYIDERTS